MKQRKISWEQLRLIRHLEWNDFEDLGKLLTGGATAIIATVTGIAAGVGSVPFRLARIRKYARDMRRRSEENRSKWMSRKVRGEVIQ
jgi:hypothetical protein